MMTSRRVFVNTSAQGDVSRNGGNGCTTCSSLVPDGVVGDLRALTVCCGIGESSAGLEKALLPSCAAGLIHVAFPHQPSLHTHRPSHVSLHPSHSLHPSPSPHPLFPPPRPPCLPLASSLPSCPFPFFQLPSLPPSTFPTHASHSVLFLTCSFIMGFFMAPLPLVFPTLSPFSEMPPCRPQSVRCSRTARRGGPFDTTHPSGLMRQWPIRVLRGMRFPQIAGGVPSNDKGMGVD